MGGKYLRLGTYQAANSMISTQQTEATPIHPCVYLNVKYLLQRGQELDGGAKIPTSKPFFAQASYNY